MVSALIRQIAGEVPNLGISPLYWEMNREVGGETAWSVDISLLSAMFHADSVQKILFEYGH